MSFAIWNVNFDSYFRLDSQIWQLTNIYSAKLFPLVIDLVKTIDGNLDPIIHRHVARVQERIVLVDCVDDPPQVRDVRKN